MDSLWIMLLFCKTEARPDKPSEEEVEEEKEEKEEEGVSAWKRTEIQPLVDTFSAFFFPC